MDRWLKIGFAALAGLALIFGAVRIGQNLKLTFIPGAADSQGSEANKDSALDEVKQKLQDSDADGLNDWDELNVYGTSAYLADTDSDKLNDYDEIKKGTDPNCPAGKECGTKSLEELKKQRNLPGTVLPPLGGTDDMVASGTEPVISPEDIKNLSADDIRSILKQGGVTDEQLQGASDDDLRKLLEEVVNIEGQ